jgi:hypothetical protein
MYKLCGLTVTNVDAAPRQDQPAQAAPVAAQADDLPF